MSDSFYANPIADFFAEYPSFTYQPSASSSASEFNRLRKHMGWEKGSDEQKDAWDKYQDAVAELFNNTFGTDADSLEAWQNLCERLKIEPVPDTLETAREAVFNTHTNLLDLAETRLHPDRDLILWPTEAELARYTKRKKKIVSASSPMAGGLLKALLRHIAHPPAKPRMRDQYGEWVGVGSTRPGSGEGDLNGNGDGVGKKKKKKKAGRRKNKLAAIYRVFDAA